MRVLVVDDSAFMRSALSNLFREEGDFEVRTARDGKEALAAIREFDPEVITLDVNMPEMDGLTCLSHIMTETPRPVVMLSSLTTAGASSTMEALAMGAVDFVPKPGGTISLHVKTIGPEIVAKVRAAVTSRRRSAPRASRPRPPTRVPESRLAAASPHVPVGRPIAAVRPGIVVIGSSTGGPAALEEVILELPSDFPLPVVVAQHMPAGFTKALAERLDGLTRLRVVEVDGMVPLAPGTVAIGRGDADIVVVRRGGTLRAVSVPNDARYLWHPSVERLALSAMSVFPAEEIIGVLLTGMGNDGANALAEVKAKGGHTVAESEDSCVVFGMPGALVALRGASTVLPANAIGRHITRIATTRNFDVRSKAG